MCLSTAMRGTTDRQLSRTLGPVVYLPTSLLGEIEEKRSKQHHSTRARTDDAVTFCSQYHSEGRGGGEQVSGQARQGQRPVEGELLARGEKGVRGMSECGWIRPHLYPSLDGETLGRGEERGEETERD